MQNNIQPLEPGDEVRYVDRNDCEMKHGKIISITGTVAFIRLKDGYKHVEMSKLKRPGYRNIAVWKLERGN